MTFGTRRDQLKATAVDWLPTKETVAIWNLASAPVGLAGAALFGLVACRGQIPSGFDLKWQEMLAIAVLTLAVFVGHELIHAGAMKRFGARPRFGMAEGASSALSSAFYATAPGHLFTRGEYLAVTLAPAALVSGVGLLLCLTPWAVVFWLPLTFHLMSCVGDLAIALRILREPAATLCEDLSDGVRFVRVQEEEQEERPEWEREP
jgi:hypothetical protein